MKINNLTIRGFRGFNQEQTIGFNPTVNLIYAPNSYGKTSITEAIEWLLYGKTSKVERGESKDEYKGSYRNCHLDSAISTRVKSLFSIGENHINFEAELVGEDAFNRFVDGSMVDVWPINSELATVSRPFIMQHALKYLLLVGPDERFKGFALLLGLDELGKLQSDFVSVCTKPEAVLPPEIITFRTRITTLESRLAVHPSFTGLYSLYKKGISSFDVFTTTLANECKNRVPDDTPDESVLPNLLRIREETVTKVFPGSISLPPYSSEDNISDSTDFEYFIKLISEELVGQYCELVSLATRDAIIQEADFYKLGFEFLLKQPGQCPFCGQKLSVSVSEHINNKHQELRDQTERSSSLSRQRQNITDMLSELKRKLDSCQNRHISRLTTFLKIDSSFNQLTEILKPKHEPYVNSVQEAVIQLQKTKNQLEQQYVATSEALNAVQLSIQQSKEEAILVRDLGKHLVSYSNTVSKSKISISSFILPMSNASEVLKHELDSVAGTEDISLLIDLNENLTKIKKAFDIDSVLTGLKELRKGVDQYVGAKMLDAVTNEMTRDVMDLYAQIRTTGDPDVHFSGFDMDRTKSGDIRSRRVQVKALSYGKELVSAVSSLSESKLNALGLCLSVAMNLKPGCPFDFLFIDDPIQSWDEEHGVQFIEVLHKLVDSGKQVILLSHNKSWLEQVRAGCRSLNGFYYEITLYDKDGPHIVQKAWCSWRQRLDEVDAIVKDASSDSVRLQHAEEEIRLVITDLTSALYFKTKNLYKNANTLNSASVRKCLVECGLSPDLIDRIGQTFETTDDSHHVTDYAAQRQRIMRYHNYSHELAKHL